MKKPKILVLSHVLPTTPKAGQEMRVEQTLKALREKFHVTFITVVAAPQKSFVEEGLARFCDEVICLDSKFERNALAKAWHKGIGAAKSLQTALKHSNYIIGDVEFTEGRLADLLKSQSFDCVLYEYWHAYKSVGAFQRKGIPCVIDTHNILWKSYDSQQQRTHLPAWWKERNLAKYKSAEETAWTHFDGIIAINKEEKRYFQEKLSDKKIFYAPMGIDMSYWKAAWKPSAEARVGFYGGLGSPHNQLSALDCYSKIMPRIWQNLPNAELWLIGSNPPQQILKLQEQDSRVKVTGFVDDPRTILQTMSAIVCPWKGTYGFRSRLIEVMAVGVPLVTTFDAVHGMDLENERGVLLAKNESEMSEKALSLLTNQIFAAEQSRLARSEVEQIYSFENTYQKLADELSSWSKTF